MIIKAEQIQMPESGEYNEVIYELTSNWNSGEWTWIKFTDDEYNEWCGEFRGSYRGHGISNSLNRIFVLTSDYLYILSGLDASLINYEEKPEYINLGVTPLGDCVVSSYYHIVVLDEDGQDKHKIETSFQLDSIKFVRWDQENLIIEAEEFTNWENHMQLSLNSRNWSIDVISQTKSGINYN